MTAIPAELLGIELPSRGGGHVESWFLKGNDPTGTRAIWLKNTIFSRPASADPAIPPVAPVAEAWAVVFDRERGHVATKSTVALSSARFARGSLDVEVDGCALSLGHARGALDSGGRTIAWDFGVGPERASPILHLPSAALYRGTLARSKIVTPLADAVLAGAVRVRRGPHEPEETWDVTGWRAMIGHNWGASHPHLYAWTHCNVWDDAEDLVLEGASTRVRVGPILSPMATILFVRWRGKSWDLNAREIFGKNRGLISLRRWEATSISKELSLKVELGAETDDFVGLHYLNPRGAMTYCLNTKLARARLELKTGAHHLVATSRAAALEIGTRDAGHGIRMYV